MSTSIETELCEYISTEITYDRGAVLTFDELLLDGALDSTDVLRLVVHVEDRYGIRIDDDELVPENFASIRSLAALVSTKRQSSAA